METSERTHTKEGGHDMTEQYVGPSAMRIANLLPHRVSFERGWFWTTAASRTGWRSGSDRTATASRSSATPGAARPAW